MFTRSLFGTRSMIRQHEILQRVATLVDEGAVRTTMTERVTGIDAANLRRAHQQIESATTRGKLVLEGFP